MSAQAPPGDRRGCSRASGRGAGRSRPGFSTADQARVNITSEWSGNTRFADANITTSGGITDTSLTMTVTIGKRRASASTNVLDEEALKRTVDLAARLATLSPEDPEVMPELGPQTYSSVNAFIDRTADLAGETRAAAIKRVVDAAVEAGTPAGNLFVAGFLEARPGDCGRHQPGCSPTTHDGRGPLADCADAGRDGKRLGPCRLP